jgi:hypothetical protein
VPVKTEAGKVAETVHFIDWHSAEKNDFAIAEEVTLEGNLERRPDIVLYVNGIAVGVLELKNSRVSIGDGIRQSLSNQQPEFNEWFFSTVQLIFAGNDSEGLQSGAIKTEEKYFLKWKEDEQDNSRFKLDKYLLRMWTTSTPSSRSWKPSPAPRWARCSCSSTSVTERRAAKDIKNVHLTVHPPTGRVRISAPMRVRVDTIRLFAISKLDWIKRQQTKLREQERETPREYVERESHDLWGKRYLLTLSESDEPPSIDLKHNRIFLRVRDSCPGGSSIARC